MTNFPDFKTSRDRLPGEPDERREAMIDIFGQHMTWTRNLALSKIRDRLRSSDVRDSLQPEQRKVYEDISTAAGEAVAMKFAEETIDVFLRHALALFGNIGFDLKLDKQHAILYLLTLQLCDIDTEEVVEEMVLNREQQEFFPDYLRLWLARRKEDIVD